MKNLLLATLIFSFMSCQQMQHVELSELILEDLNGMEVKLIDASGSGIAVFIFMSPDCPLCINYTKTIMDIRKQFMSQGVQFIPVYSGQYYTNEEILSFHRTTHFDLPGLLDPDFLLANMLSATVTPQAVVISGKDEIIYSGAIDDWMYETGKKKPIITHKYLETALIQALSGKNVDPRKTEAIGCFIEL